ncbi:MAG: hypothetical protein R3B96_21030 [Pirellulaceae bacterium]
MSIHAANQLNLQHFAPPTGMLLFMNSTFNGRDDRGESSVVDGPTWKDLRCEFMEGPGHPAGRSMEHRASRR